MTGTQEQEIKRAKNMIWSAAGSYSFEPRFIGLKPDQSADEYLNMMNSLVYKWFDFDALDSLFSSFSGKHEALFTGLLWIGLEHAVYEKELPDRPVLEELRLDYARENLLLQRSTSPEGDTAQEVRALKAEGILVLGVFMGLESSTAAAAEIFGKDFVKIKEISQFADAVGNILTSVFS